jgi:ADP-ribose pyrophosphatase YjhB (NUDIX family)
MRRKYPSRPILGVGAIVIRRGRILLVQRGKAPLKGYWSLPGGALELGEHLADGVRREILEETGLTVKPLEVFEVFERISPGERGRPEYHYVVVDYLCRVAGGVLRPAADAERAEWVRQQDLGRYRITEGTLAVIRRAFRKKLRGGIGAA